MHVQCLEWVADAANWRERRTYEIVLSSEVLEHAPRWDLIVANAWEAVDGLDVRPGEHYRNVEPADVLELPGAWCVDRLAVEACQGRGDLYVRTDKPSG